MSRSVRAGHAFVEVGLKSKVHEGVRRIQTELRTASRMFGSLGAALTGTAGAAGAAMLPLLGRYKEFDDAILAVKAKTNASAEEYEMLRASAKRLGAETSFTATQVANLMEELGKSNFSPDEIDGMTSSVMNLSRATGTEAALSSGIMAAAIRQFNLEAGDATRVADTLTYTANGSFNTLDQLGEALKYAGVTASDAGYSIEETAAILGTLGNVGIQGSMAGTTLKRLVTLSAAEADKLKRIFGVAFKDSSGNARPLLDVLEEVNAATADLGSADRAAKFNEAFGLLGITGASAIGKAAGSARELYAEIQKAGGVAEKTAKEMDSGFGGFFRRMMSALDGVSNALGEALDGSLKNVSETITNVASFLSKWIDKNQDVVVFIAATIAAAGALGVAFLAIAAGTHVAIVAIGTLNSIVGLAVGGMAAMRVAVATTQGIIAIAKVSTLGLAAAKGVLATAAAGTGVSALLASTAITGLSIASGIATTASAALAAGMATASAGGGILAVVGAAVQVAWAPVAGVFAAVVASITPVGIAIAAVIAIMAVLAGAWVVAVAKAGAFQAVMGSVSRMLREFLDIAKDVSSGVIRLLASGEYSKAAKLMWAGLKAIFWTGAHHILQAFVKLWPTIMQGTKNFFSQLLSSAANVFASIPRMMKAALTGSSPSAILADALSRLNDFDFNFGDRIAMQAIAARKELKQLKDEAAKNETAKKEAAAKGFESNGEGSNAASGSDSGKGESTESSDVIQQRIRSLQEEIEVLQLGEEAADRKRLAEQGATEEQLKDIAVLQARRRELQELADERERDFDRFVDGMKRAADTMSESGKGPGEIFARQIALIQKQLQAGKLTQDEASQAKDDAKADRDARIKRMQDEGKRLEESLRTPLETMQAELKRIEGLRNAGTISAETASRAKAKAREAFEDQVGGEEKAPPKLGIAKAGSKEAFETLRRTQQRESAITNENAWVAPLVENARLQIQELQQVPARMAEALKAEQQKLVDTSNLENLQKEAVSVLGTVASAAQKIETNTRKNKSEGESI